MGRIMRILLVTVIVFSFGIVSGQTFRDRLDEDKLLNYTFSEGVHKIRPIKSLEFSLKMEMNDNLATIANTKGYRKVLQTLEANDYINFTRYNLQARYRINNRVSFLSGVIIMGTSASDLIYRVGVNIKIR